jgi:hypothetical protein
MKKFFYLGVVLLVLFEIANIYFIMPLPGSQRMGSIDVAYRLHAWRWPIRGFCVAFIVAGLASAWNAGAKQRVAAAGAIVLATLVGYAANFQMAADRIFLAPTSVSMQPAARNVVDTARLVVGIEVGAEARAYPVQFIGYHHQVRDTIAGRPVMVSFCTVCRTGRVFIPVVDGRAEKFRLVGMDHFNAMFEDVTTGSWWRQATGQAIAGSRKGERLAELQSDQVTLAQWLRLHPKSLIMQPDAALASRYSKSFDYETGASRSVLTGTDTVSWHDKAWVVGIERNGASKAYDWNRLRRETVINDSVGHTPIAIVLAHDGASFFAFVRPDPRTTLALRGDSLVGGKAVYALDGQSATTARLPRIEASQEFWHSWRAFHPTTLTY